MSRYTVAPQKDARNPRNQLVDAAGVLKEMADGSTLILQGLQLFHPPAGQLMRELADSLGTRVFINAFLTPPGAKGFGDHSDPYGAFLVQLAGKKIWKLRSFADEEPTTVTLGPRDVLWIPRGWRHDGQAAPDRASIHLTLAVRPLEAIDILNDIAGTVGRLLADEMLPPLAGADPDDLRHQVETLVTKLAKAVGETDVDALVAHARAQSATALPAQVTTALGDDFGGPS
ncbi:cupin domain-containing protein [Kineosporia mesophila]|uniref:cupin domain-containing protein n=1 Tax=Kineosporia mesophila TaxID=566012 RepID=UPI001E4D4970|nr:cupin domain-containing protein [Kineosporia mesophila]